MMLVDNSIYRNQYVANGSSDTFPISFPFLDNSHVVVYSKYNDTQELVSPALYTITGAGNERGGTLRFNAAPMRDTVIVILRAVPLTQETDYVELQNFPAETHEDALTKLTMITQQLQEQLDRSVILEATDDTNPIQYAKDLFAAKDRVLAAEQVAVEKAAEATERASRAVDSATTALSAAQAAEEHEGQTYQYLLEAREATSHIGDVVSMTFQTSNYDATTIAESDLAANAIVDIGIPYLVGRNTLSISVDGTVWYRNVHYVELGQPETASSTIRLLLPLEEGANIHAWSIVSNQTASVTALANQIHPILEDAQFAANDAHVQANRARDMAVEAQEAADRADDAAVDGAKILARNNALAACIESKYNCGSVYSMTMEQDAPYSPNGFFIINPYTGVCVTRARDVTPLQEDEEIPMCDGFYLFAYDFPPCEEEVPTLPDRPRPDPEPEPEMPTFDLNPWQLPCGRRVRV